MADLTFPNHAYEQMIIRGLAGSLVEIVLKNPELIPEEGRGQVIHQPVVQRDDEDCLLAVIFDRLSSQG